MPPTRSRSPGPPCLQALLLLLGCVNTLHAQGLNATGVTGGLSIPDARSLGNGTLAFGFGNPGEPQVIVNPQRRVSYVLGVGLAPGLDLIGRLAEYSIRDATGFGIGGISDLSGNVKFSTALGSGPQAMRVALGADDFRGGAVNFRAAYAVATQPWGPWSLTLGLGSSKARHAPGTSARLDGLFGGIDYRIATALLPGSLTLSAEHDGRQPLAGLRWTSPPWAALAGARLSASAHRTAERGSMPGQTAFGFFLTVPFGEQESAAAETKALPITAVTLPEAVSESVPARMGRLKEQLVALGLEKVRVGRAGDDWVVVFQNRRYGHGELDALGLVLGLAAEAAPPRVQRIVAGSLKAGQPALTVSVPAQAWRAFLGDGREGAVRDLVQVERGAAYDAAAIDWIADKAGPATWAQFHFTPELNYTIGTEYGASDYSLAGHLAVTVPLWTGAQLLLNVRKLIGVSEMATENAIFSSIRQATGRRALAVQQTLWLGRHAVVSGVAGTLENGARGVEGDAIVFVPGRDDTLRLRGRRLELLPVMPPGADLQQWVTYRWVPDFGSWSRNTWVEVGVQRYSDLSHGPTLTVSRWWGNFGAHLTYRRGGLRQFGGMEISIPLTPRIAPAAGPVHVSGPSQWRQGLRTRITDRHEAANWLEPRAVRDYGPAWDMEARNLDAGRLAPRYTINGLFRMRAAFFELTPTHH